jgi:hypothetical protein
MTKEEYPQSFSDGCYNSRGTDINEKMIKPHNHKEGYQIYGCGHTHKGLIIMDSNLLSIAAYLDWKDSVGLDGDKSQCFDCYIKCSW